MKININTILPIALSVLLPGLSLYAKMEADTFILGNFLVAWLVTSVYLYAVWQLLWYTWNLEWIHRLIWIGLGLIVFIGSRYLLDRFVVSSIVDDNLHLLPFRISLIFILFGSIQYALKAQQNIAQLKLDKEQMQTENYRAQLKALRAKIDPHFLFNSLNTLRSMVRQQHVNSEAFIMSLAAFYRQTLKYNENSTLQLAEEMEVLASYLFLMKSRNEEAVNVEVAIDEELKFLHLPTLALQVVVENCFKHNSMTAKKPLSIKIKSKGDCILVYNNIQPRFGMEEASGFGLELLRKRYALLNVEDGLQVKQDKEQFCVKLKLLAI